MINQNALGATKVRSTLVKCKALIHHQCSCDSTSGKVTGGWGELTLRGSYLDTAIEGKKHRFPPTGGTMQRNLKCEA
jgi:hypothetical protein